MSFVFQKQLGHVRYTRNLVNKHDRANIDDIETETFKQSYKFLCACNLSINVIFFPDILFDLYFILTFSVFQ